MGKSERQKLMEKHFKGMHKLLDECMDVATKKCRKRNFEKYESYPLAIIGLATAIYNLRAQEIQAGFQIEQQEKMEKMRAEAMKKQGSKGNAMAELAQSMGREAKELCRDKDCNECHP